MFKFLFRRSPKTPPAPAVAPPPEASARPDRRAEADNRRQTALRQLESLHDEHAIADFLLHCEAADVRLQAAGRLHTKDVLERVLPAMRKSDRRVAKLVQTRLKEVEHDASRRRRAEECIATAERLLRETDPAASKVAELDRVWAASGTSDPALTERFARVRAALAERLRAQAELLRGAGQTLAELRRLLEAGAEGEPESLTSELARLSQAFEQRLRDPLAAALPKAVPEQFGELQAKARARIEAARARRSARQERERLLEGWENADPAALRADELKKAWRAAPPLDEEAGAETQGRFDAVLRRLTPARTNETASPAPAAAPAAEDDRETGRRFTEALDALETALQDGLLQAASAQDKILRGLDLKGVRLPDAQSSRLAHLRHELQRLSDWARWGGNVSREELLKAVEELPGQDLPVTELAKKVGSSRERWKSLDASAGPAPRALWERFDAACTAAYAPVAAHYQKLAQERQNHLEQARALLEEASRFRREHFPEAGEAVPEDVDWKALAAYVRQLVGAWRRIGPVDRKEKKRLDVEFDTLLKSLQLPLQRQRELEIARREQLIADVTRLDPHARGTVEELRTIQSRWQTLAKTVPLEHRDEQALWQRFREASDALFAARRSRAEAADGERQHHQASKESLCLELERLAAEEHDAAVLTRRLRDADQAWSGIGPVPRTAEKAIEQRYQAAVAALRERLERARRAAAQARSQALRDKWQLCVRLENALAQGQPFDESWEANWDALLKLDEGQERRLLERFNAAHAALQRDDRTYAAALEERRGQLERELLKLEILAGVDSPPEAAAERLRVQVDVLQASLKNGRRPTAPAAQLTEVLSLPALTDAVVAGRLDRVVQALTEV